MKQFSYFFNFPVALFFLVVTLIDPSLALCNGADAIMCCLNTGPASDPLIALQLLLSGVQVPAQDTVIGVGCTPITNTASTWYVNVYRLGVSPTKRASFCIALLASLLVVMIILTVCHYFLVLPCGLFTFFYRCHRNRMRLAIAEGCCMISRGYRGFMT